jgi:hypothetical protein
MLFFLRVLLGGQQASAARRSRTSLSLEIAAPFARTSPCAEPKPPRDAAWLRSQNTVSVDLNPNENVSVRGAASRARALAL